MGILQSRIDFVCYCFSSYQWHGRQSGAILSSSLYFMLVRALLWVER